MSAAVVLECEAEVEFGPRRKLVPCLVRISTRQAMSVGEARAAAAKLGWWWHRAIGDRCPDHAPKRRGQ